MKAKVPYSKYSRSRRPCSEFYSRYFSSKVSALVSYGALNLNIHPNVLTLCMLLGLVPCCFLVVSSDYYTVLFSLMFMPMVNVFDTADGELARFTGKLSNYGIYLDKIVQVVVDFIFICALGFFLQRSFQYPIVPYIVALLPIVYLIDSVGVILAKGYMRGQDSRVQGESLRPIYRLKKLLLISCSNTGLMHLAWLFLFADILILGEDSSPVFLFSYYIFVSVLYSFKMAIRQVIIFRGFAGE